MERLDWKLPIRANVMILKMVGMWPPGDETYGHSFYTLYAAVVIFIELSHVSFETINLYFILDDLEAVTATVFILLMEMLGILKAYCVTTNMKMLKELMITLDSDLFQPKNEQQKKLVLGNLLGWRMMYIPFMSLAVTWVITFCSFPFLDSTSEPNRLPFLAWYPYNVKIFPNYQLTYLYQTVAISYLTMTNINIDSFIGALNMYIGSQFDILRDDLKNLHKYTSNVNEKLLEIIHYHKEILKFADYANQFYNWMLLFEFIIGGISIGLSMFQLTIVTPFSTEFYSFCCYSSGISLQVLMYCWFGNEIELKSGNLAYAVFESEWIDVPPETKKLLIFFVLRLQKSLQISALGLVNLSVETFMKIMRTAWSYFALLRQVHARH